MINAFLIITKTDIIYLIDVKYQFILFYYSSNNKYCECDTGNKPFTVK